MEDPWVSVSDAAKAENVTTQTVEKWVSAGKVPSRLDSQGRRQVRLGAPVGGFDTAQGALSVDGELQFVPTGTSAPGPRPGPLWPLKTPRPGASRKGLAAWLTLAVLLVAAGAAGWWAMDTAATAKNQVINARITTAGVANRLWDTIHALRAEKTRAEGLAAELEREWAERTRLEAEMRKAAADLAAAQRRLAQLQAATDRER